uniref:G_PROTEIN_RECEP_F1_2 domain-containing protein n=1 Tax=Heterorhabditis bacteriophora TaxID=37862 RepID=A0A1I7XA25_HETBA
MVEFEIYSPRYSKVMSAVDMENCSPQSDGILRCPQPGTPPIEYYVRNVYPPIQIWEQNSTEIRRRCASSAPSNYLIVVYRYRRKPWGIDIELQPKVLLVVVIFVMCFVVGICGNSSILTIIRGVMEDRRTRSRRSGDNAILYIAALCVCDFLMSLSLPPAILDSVIGFWIFGTWMCKLHHICGSVGRIVSTFLITAMSFDRYVAVCHPHHHRLRSRSFVLGMIACLSIFAFFLLLPMLTYARAKEMVLHELKAIDSFNITRVRVFKCSDMMPPPIFYWFTSTTFILGYIVPLVLIVYFNLKLIKKLYAHKRFSVLYAIVMSIVGLPTTTSELLLFVIYCVHLLPYFGSSSNWILYGLLNTQLQVSVMKNENQLNDEHMSIITAVNTNNHAELRNRVLERATRSIGDAGRSFLDAQMNNVVQYAACNGAALIQSESETSMHFYQDTEQTHL